MKKLIAEKLRSILEAIGDKYIPYNEKPELVAAARQGFSNKPVNTAKAVAEITSKIAQAKNISKQFKEAYDAGNDSFEASWNGQRIIGNLKAIRAAITSPSGQNTNYKYYFDDPNSGDGGFQGRLHRNGTMTITHVKAAPSMADDPNLSSQTDAGYYKEFMGTYKYFKVKAGFLGKYQTEAKNYSVFASPAADAAIKLYSCFPVEMLDFVKGSLDYTSDEKGKELSNQADLESVLKKIQKDSEIQLGRRLDKDKIWLDYKDYLRKSYSGDKPTPFKINADREMQDFIEKYKSKKIFSKLGPKEIGMSPEEKEAFDKEQQEKNARYQQFLQRKNKGR